MASDQWSVKLRWPSGFHCLLAPDRCLPMKAFRNLRTIGALLLLVMVIGTAGYHFIEGWPWFDGFYMVVTTLTTIGYQEVHPLSHAGRVFNVFVIVSGVSLLLLGVGALSQALLEFELQSFFGRRRMEREISAANGPLHHLRDGASGPQRGPGTGAQAGRHSSSSKMPRPTAEVRLREAGWRWPGTLPRRQRCEKRRSNAPVG